MFAILHIIFLNGVTSDVCAAVLVFGLAALLRRSMAKAIFATTTWLGVCLAVGVLAWGLWVHYLTSLNRCSYYVF